MVEVELGKEYVTLKLEGSQKFLALKSSVRIPLKKIDTVSTDAVKPLWLGGKIGTHMPPIFWEEPFGPWQARHSTMSEIDPSA